MQRATTISKNDPIRLHPVSYNRERPFFQRSAIHEHDENETARQLIPIREAHTPAPFFKPSVPFLQRKCSHCEEEQENKLQRKEKKGGSTQAATPTDEDRREYAEMQDRFFSLQGELMTSQILRSAGFAKDVSPTTPADAEKLIKYWGLSMSTIISEMKQIASSLLTRVTGTTTSADLLQQQSGFISALSTTGQDAYKKAIKLVKDEPFWNKFIADNEVYIFPDLQGKNRFSGYNQVVKDPNDPTGQRKVIIVHISADPLNNNFPEISSSTIVHELSHVLYDPAVLKRALASFRSSVTDLLIDHPDIAATRAAAADPAIAREEQKQRISQILFETIAYGETEIFVHLQQLTHQPDVTIKHDDGTEDPLRGAQLLQHEILRYVRRMRKIGLEPQMLKGVLSAIGTRADLLFDRRVAAWPKGSKQREIMIANKKMAQLIFEMALKNEEL